MIVQQGGHMKNRLLTPLRRRRSAPRTLVSIALAVTLAALTFATASSARLGRSAANEPVQVWLSTTSGSSMATKLAQQSNVTFGAQTGTTPAIDVDPATTYQTMDGFGAAMTDSGAWLINGSSQRNAMMSDLFSGSGINLSFVRLPMGASDISRNNYSYDDTCCDLNDFSV